VIVALASTCQRTLGRSFSAFHRIPVSLWIDPDASTFGAASDPTGSISTTTGTDGLDIDRFNMLQNTAASVPAMMQWVSGTTATLVTVEADAF
jgi:hypothetical protein